MQKQGFDNCQLICWELSRYTWETAQAILELTKTYGVEISAVWCGWSGPAEWIVWYRIWALFPKIPMMLNSNRSAKR